MLTLQLRIDVQIRRRTGATAQVLVTTAHRQISLRRLELNSHGPSRVGQVPQGQRAMVMGHAGQGRHIESGAVAVIDM